MAAFLLPSVQQGFGTSFTQTKILIGFLYDVGNGILYTIYPTQNYDVFLKVPFSIAQQLSVANKQLGGSYQNPNIPNPDNVYAISIMGANPAPVLETPSDVELSTPGGDWLTTVQTAFVPQFPRCLLCETGAPLLTETGGYLVVN